jgi:hypothetical protein
MAQSGKAATKQIWNRRKRSKRREKESPKNLVRNARFFPIVDGSAPMKQGEGSRRGCGEADTLFLYSAISAPLREFYLFKIRVIRKSVV